MQPRIFGPYEPIRRDYPIAEYLSDLAGTGVDGLGLLPDQLAAERRAHRSRMGRCRGEEEQRRAAGHDRLLQSPLRRRAGDAGGRGQGLEAGARHPHAAPLAREPALPLRAAAGPDEGAAVPQESREAAGSRLAVRAPDLHQPDEGLRTALIKDFPGINFVLLHAGMLEDHVRCRPRRMARRHAAPGAAAQPLCQAFRPRHLHPPRGSGAYRRYRLPTIEMFGAGRCVFGSNFPIEKLWSQLCGLVQRLSRGARKRCRKPIRVSVFSETARRLYRL